MKDVADIIADLVRAGVDPDLIGRTAAALAQNVQNVQIVQDPVADKRREYDRKRKMAKRLSTGIPPDSADSGGQPPLDKEAPHTPKEITPPIRPLKGAHTPREELEKVLDEEHAAAVIDHRQRIRKPLTAHAAKLMAGKLAQCPDANAAADVMIANGWQGFEPEWLESRSQRATAPPGPSMNDALDALLNGKSHAPHSGPTFDASFTRTDRGGSENPIQFDALPSGRGR